MLIVFCFICLLPLLMTISISLTDGDSIARYGYRLIPDRISLKAYEYVFAQPQQVITGYRNSLYITIVGTVLNVFVTAMAAYPLSRADFRFRGALSVYIFVTMIFSGGLVASNILVVRYLHLKNSLMALILLPVAAPYNIFLTRILFQDISPSLIEAAELDGSGEFNTFIRIVMPLSMPIIVYTALTSFTWPWSDYILPKLLLKTNDTWTVAVGLMSLGETEFSRFAAGSIFIAVPIVILYLFLAKYLINGMVTGAVKD